MAPFRQATGVLWYRWSHGRCPRVWWPVGQRACAPHRVFGALPAASRPGVQHSRSPWMPPSIWEPGVPRRSVHTRQVARSWLPPVARSPRLEPRGVSEQLPMTPYQSCGKAWSDFWGAALVCRRLTFGEDFHVAQLVRDTCDVVLDIAVL